MSTGRKTKPKLKVATDHLTEIVRQGYRDAVGVLDACNMRGIMRSAPEFILAVEHDLDRSEIAMAMPCRRHPITVLYVAKLVEMASLGLADGGPFGLAYALAKRVNDGSLDLDSPAYREELLAYYKAFPKLIA